MPIDPTQPKKPQDPNAQTGVQAQTQDTPAPSATPSPARPSNPPVPGTGPNGPTNPQAAATPQAQVNPANQVQGSGYVSGQRYMDLLGPQFQQQAAARAKQAFGMADQTQRGIDFDTANAIEKQNSKTFGAKPVANANVAGKFSYDAPDSMKAYMGDKLYGQRMEDATMYGDQAASMGSDAGLSAFMQTQGVSPGAMSDYDAAMLGMGTSGFSDGARRYGDLLGQLNKGDKAINDNYKKNKESSDAAQKKFLDDAKKTKMTRSFENRKSGAQMLKEHQQDESENRTKRGRGQRGVNP